MTLTNGDRYEGELAEGLRSGYGVLRLTGGDVYSGHFLLDKREGRYGKRVHGRSDYGATRATAMALAKRPAPY